MSSPRIRLSNDVLEILLEGLDEVESHNENYDINLVSDAEFDAIENKTKKIHSIRKRLKHWMEHGQEYSRSHQ